MRFTDIFIKKPVLSVVVSLIILLLGLRALTTLKIRQFPKIEDTLITVQTAYPGASPTVIKGFITTPLERAIASAEGVDYMTSSSTEGLSTIQIYMVLNYDPNAALAEIQSEVNSILNELPKQSQLPLLTKTSVTNVPYLILGFISKTMTGAQVTDYVNRVVVPQIQSVNGVGQINIFDNKAFAMRIWLNPQKMAQYNLTADQVYNAISENNYISATGYTKGPYIQINTSAATDLRTVKQFRNLVVANYNGTLVKLKDISTVELGAINYQTKGLYKGKNAIVFGIFTTPTANPLSVVTDIRTNILPGIKKQLPSGLELKIIHDRTEFITGSIDEVVKTIIITLIVVIFVIFLFLGSYRSLIIPVIAIPLALVGGFFIMFLLNYTLNLLTLLAMVLAIGLVVDDAIIIVENVDRHILEGKTPFQSALLAARELGIAIIAMTLTLIAVFLPIGFMTGLTGALFKEFAFTLAGDVIISGIVALTLSPMLCSKFLKQDMGKKGFTHFLDKTFDKIRKGYSKRLHSVLDYKYIMLLVIVVVLASMYFLFKGTKSELAPTEDQGVIMVMGETSPTATLASETIYAKQLDRIYQSFPEGKGYFIAFGKETVFSGIVLKPWNQRKKTEMQLIPLVQKKLNNVPGLKLVAIPMPSMPASQGLPIQFVVTTAANYTQLESLTNKFMAETRKSGLFAYIDSDLKIDQPQIDISINKDKAQAMGVNMQQIGDTLSTLLSENYVNWFIMQGYSYKVIPQVIQKFRYTPEDLGKYYVQATNGQLVPLSSVISIKTSVVPESLNQFNQLNSATISATLNQGVTLGQALSYMENLFPKVFPKGYTYNFAGESRQFVQQGNTLMITFIFSIIIIFLMLAALFESFVDPLIVLFSVPMSIAGALIFLNLGFATVNIYTEMGLLMLIGLVSKHGILIVRFANDLQENEGLDKRTAVERAAAIRLRPILMTTGAMVFGVFPLVFTKGPGSVSRFDIGLVIATGLGIGTFLTIFVVPTVYLLIAKVKKPLKNPTQQQNNTT